MPSYRRVLFVVMYLFTPPRDRAPRALNVIGSFEWPRGCLYDTPVAVYDRLREYPLDAGRSTKAAGLDFHVSPYDARLCYVPKGTRASVRICLQGA